MLRTSILSDADVRAFLADQVATSKVAFTVPGLDSVTGALKGVGDQLGAYRDPLLGGLAGAAVGGAGLGLSTSRRGGETDDELSRRRWGNVATGALAGGAAGVGGGMLLDAGHEEAPGGVSRFFGALGNRLKPGDNVVTGTGEGALAGHLGGSAIVAANDRVNGIKGPSAKLDAATEAAAKGLGDPAAQAIRTGVAAGTPMTGPLTSDEERYARLLSLSKKMNASGDLTKLNPLGEISKEQRALNVHAGTPGTRALRAAMTIGGAGLGLYNAWPSDN